jgi:hypothetical protein
MADQVTVPEEFEISIRRIMPYLAAPLQKDPKVLESLLLYLKLGGEKMARIVIDALNVTQRLQDAEVKKHLREQELLRGESLDDLDDDDSGDEDENENGEKENSEVFDDDAPDP